MLEKLKGCLLEKAGEAIDGSAREMPTRFRHSLHETVEHDFHIELSLLACASSLWCGGDEYLGMPAAVGSLLLRAGIASHMGTSGLPDVFSASPGSGNGDETLAILTGDGLIALGMEYLAGNGGRHSSRLVAEAVRALGSRGVLAGYSLGLDRVSGIETASPDGRADFELYSGQLARFASHGGALLAGATGLMQDDAAQIGLLTGRARFLSELSEREDDRERKSEMIFQARTLIEQAQTIAGNRENSTLFTSLMYLSDFF
ncbi:MAG: hypothetical protein JXA64_09600 [Candidatus Fermentibacteraceae bacterium]|nr:hypothetical protein [Candidatus Fermentibacteraceae bacterium]MBN2609354.1 hypothetical protein [Candidatus Fermentibacteraceae bacterium]